MVDAVIAVTSAKEIPGAGKALDVSNMKYVFKKLTFGTAGHTYATGGMALDLRTYSKDGATEPIMVTYADFVNTAYDYKYDSANHKLLIYTAGAELGNGTNIGAKFCNVLAIYA